MKALSLSAATLLLGSAFPSYGLTLGPPQGAAWIGQPLNLVFPLTLDGREAGGNLCLEADVRQGDVRMDDKRFTLSLEPGRSPNTPRVQLRTTHAIVEPVVVVRLSAGCEFKSTRQYTLLADLPMTPAVVAPPARASAPAERAPSRWTSGDSEAGSGSGSGSRSGSSSGNVGGAPVAPQRSSTRRASSSATASASRSQAEREAARTRQRASAPPVRRESAAATRAATPKPAATKQAAAVPAAPEEGKSRLLIEPLTPSTTPGAAATARQAATTPPAAVPSAAAPLGAPAVPSAPSASPSVGVSPAAAGAASAGPASADANAPASAAVPILPDPQAQDRDAARLKAMEEALATLRAQSDQTQKLMLEMRSELMEARSSRYQNWLVYSLLGLLAVMLLLLLFMWRSLRQAQQAAWWREGQVQGDSKYDEEGDEEADAEGKAPARKFARTTIRGPLSRLGELPDDGDEDEDDEQVEKHAPRAELESHDDAQVLAEGQRRGMVGGPGFERAHIRSVNTEELFDVQQQADFFMSLGKHDQAIGVLREHIASNPGTSALAYLDLLSILHSLDRRDEYVRQSAAFEQRFNVAVPPFEGYSAEGRGLEHYPLVVARIEAVWPGVGALDLIEELLFRQPGGHDEVFDLTAYQELLLLHAVARDAAEQPAGKVPTVAAALGLGSATPAREHQEYGQETMVQPLAEPLADLDDESLEQTMPMPYLPDAPRHQSAPLIMPAVDLDMADLDRTAFQTLRAPIENLPLPKPEGTSTTDPHVIDFNPFDPEIEEELKPGRFTIKR